VTRIFLREMITPPVASNCFEKTRGNIGTPAIFYIGHERTIPFDDSIRSMPPCEKAFAKPLAVFLFPVVFKNCSVLVPVLCIVEPIVPGVDVADATFRAFGSVGQSEMEDPAIEDDHVA